jgi:hypothetical protein
MDAVKGHQRHVGRLDESGGAEGQGLSGYGLDLGNLGIGVPPGQADPP